MVFGGDLSNDTEKETIVYDLYGDPKAFIIKLSPDKKIIYLTFGLSYHLAKKIAVSTLKQLGEEK